MPSTTATAVPPWPKNSSSQSMWWGALVVLGVIVAAVSLVLRGRSRDGATGAIAGVLLGYAGVILLALFRGAL